MCAYFLVYHLNVIDPTSRRQTWLRRLLRHSALNTWDLPTWDGTR